MAIVAVALLPWVTVVSPAGAGTPADAGKGASAGPPPADENKASRHDSESVPTAEDVLKALQKKRPLNVPVVPASLLDQPDGLRGSGRRLLPEGHPITKRLGRLVLEDKWWVFAFESKSAAAPIERMRLLPSSQLEQMVSTVQNTTESLLFQIQGEVTVFQGENYLLPGTARLPANFSGSASGLSADDETDSASSLEDGEDKPRLQNRTTSDGEPSVDDVLEAMKSRRPSSVPIVNRRKPGSLGTLRGGSFRGLAEARRGADGFTDGNILLREGHPISMRPGRLVEEDDWWVFVFESDHPDRPEPRMKLLPSMQLERMVDAIDGAATALVFVVSGEVTIYRGENYLLPRVARRRVDSGNLSK